MRLSREERKNFAGCFLTVWPWMTVELTRTSEKFIRLGWAVHLRRVRVSLDRTCVDRAKPDRGDVFVVVVIEVNV